MRLDGRLEDFGLPDVLQLLAQTRKSGGLLLEAADGSRQGIIRLGSGAVDGASSDLHRQAFARRLVGSGLVADDALEQAAADVHAGAPSLTRALLDRARLSPVDITPLAAAHATDAVCELLRWTAGGFSFRVGESDPDGLALGLSAGDLVAEGERRMAVWPDLTTRIPSPDTVLRLSAAPPTDPTCTREEWALVALVDGVRSVGEIVALLGRSEFAVAQALAALVERGLLTVSAVGSGLAELQRRQAVITSLESGRSTSPSRPAAAPVVAEQSAVPLLAPPLTTPAVPPARTAPALQTAGALALHATPSTVEQPDDVAEPTIRGLDSAVTKSLVLRLIAGVRAL